MPRSATRPPEAAPPESQAHAPLLSSASRGWRGVEVALHHFERVVWLAPMPRHVAGLHITGAVNLLQSRGGRKWVRHVRAGDVTFTPRGEPKRFQHSGDNVVLLVSLDARSWIAWPRTSARARPRSRCSRCRAAPTRS